MIILAIDTLTLAEQLALQDWLVLRHGRTRVVSTTSASLMPLVESGAFSDALYYRLNVVSIDLTGR
jgi:transcriptional regulator of acetoin/glycerol metabolism